MCETIDVKTVTVSRAGYVWLLGEHRVMCGDSACASDVERLMAGQKAQLLHADPPYGMGKEGLGIKNDNLRGDKLDEFHLKWWAAVRPFLVDIASVYIWGNAPDLWRLWYRRGGLAELERLTFRNEIVWDKGSAPGIRTAGGRMYTPATERCLFFVLGEQVLGKNADVYWEGWDPIRLYLATECQKMGWGPKDIRRICGVDMYKHWFTKSQWTFIPRRHYEKLRAAARGRAPGRDYDDLKREFWARRVYFDNTHDVMTDVWRFDRVVGGNRWGHAAPKPVAMMERIMRTSLPPGGLCLDPFGGSGSALIAAEKTGRGCYTMEIVPQYCDIIVKRWQELTGEAARLENTGQTFAEIEVYANSGRFNF